MRRQRSRVAAASTGQPNGCAELPRTDAHFCPPLGYDGAHFTVGSVDGQFVTPGDCASQTEILSNGWVHYRLGADPTG